MCVPVHSYWASREALVESQGVWESGVEYHAAILNFAQAIAKTLVKQGDSSTFTCVHLRRGK